MSNYKNLWHYKGLCHFREKYCERSCDVINKLIENMPGKERIKYFRASSEYELNDIATSRGEFGEIDLEEMTPYEVINKIFNHIRDTLNNKKKEGTKLYSYSKCLTVPLFKYSNNSNPIIGIEDSMINVIDITFIAYYYQWIKGYHSRDDERGYLCECENTYAFNEIFEGVTLPEIINSRLNIDYIENLRKCMENDEYNQMDLSDLDDISNIKINDFIIDVSSFSRSILNDYLKYCNSNRKSIKRFASYQKDYEIISSKGINEYSCIILKGKKLIELMRFISICILFVENMKGKISLKYYEIINEFIEELVDDISKDDVKLVRNSLMDTRDIYMEHNERDIYDELCIRGEIESINYYYEDLQDEFNNKEVYNTIRYLLNITSNRKHDKIYNNLFNDELIDRLKALKDKTVVNILIDHLRNNYDSESDSLANCDIYLKRYNSNISQLISLLKIDTSKYKEFKGNIFIEKLESKLR